jgi:NAD-dependent SIR2 family protein deacetylase
MKGIVTGKQCQCTKCFRTFSTENNFDRHRKGEYKTGRYCVDPRSVGLKKNPNGVWVGKSDTKPQFWGEQSA